MERAAPKFIYFFIFFLTVGFYLWKLKRKRKWLCCRFCCLLAFDCPICWSISDKEEADQAARATGERGATRGPLCPGRWLELSTTFILLSFLFIGSVTWFIFYFFILNKSWSWIIVESTLCSRTWTLNINIILCIIIILEF